MPHVHLKTIWIELCKRYTNNESLIDELWNEIDSAYSNKKRKYHNLTHLQYMIEMILPLKNEIRNWDILLFSIFYHDIIYRATKSDNEIKSAQFAEKRLIKLGLEPPLIDLCKNQIIATKSHNSIGDPDTDILLDADLAILGDSSLKYESYTRQIRAEYSIFPDFMYNSGRKKVLNHFLAMNRIFKTKHFYDNLEKQADQNIRNELQTLS